MKNFIIIVSILIINGLKAQDDVYFVETDTIRYKLNIPSKLTKGIAYPPLYRISEYKEIHHQFYYTSRMQPYYIPVSHLLNNSYYNNLLYEPPYIGRNSEFPNYPSHMDRPIFNVNRKEPRTSENIPNKYGTHINKTKENTAGRKF